MDKYTIIRSNGLPIRFSGALLASCDSSRGTKDKYTRLDLYRTDSGKYVSVEHGVTPGETKVWAYVHNDIDSVTAKLGHGWLSQELYRLSGLDVSIDV